MTSQKNILLLFGSKVHKFTFFSRATESQSCPSLWAKWRPQKPDHISRVWFGQPMAGRDHNMETQKLNQFGGLTSFSIGQKWRKWVVRKPMACQMSITTRYKRQFYKRWLIALFIFYIIFCISSLGSREKNDYLLKGGFYSERAGEFVISPNRRSN